MKYAVIASQGKQFRVSEGDIIELNNLPGKKEEEVTFSDVLLLVEEKTRKIGKPTVSGVKVTGKILSQGKGTKVRVAKFKAKSRYRRVRGFRPLITKVQIAKIG